MSSSFCDCVNQWEKAVRLQDLKDTKYLSVRTRGEQDFYPASHRSLARHRAGWRDVHTIMTSRVTIINGAVTGGWARHGLIRHDSDTRQVEIVISDRIICYNSDNFPTRQTTCLLAGPQNAILHCTVPRSSFQHSPGQTFTWRHSGFTILKSKYYSVVYLQRDLMIFPEII